MRPLDWLILGVFAILVVGSALYVRRLTRSVADFLAGGRVGGRYLLTIACQMGALGAISMVAQWEASYHSGWGGTWWAVILAPVWMIITLSGWVIYRFRETRALTLAQFFEMRYSRRFRVFAGLLAFVSGTLNYGIFPSVGARFLMHVCGLPEWNVGIGGFDLSLMYALLMAALLGFALWITLAGGQVTVMVTDAFQGILCLLIAVALTFYCIHRVGWEQIAQAVALAPNPETASMINPFKTSHVRDFNLWFYLIAMFSAFYSCMAWQGTAGYNASARNAHEARMARVLATWRGGTLLLVIGFMAMAAYTVMHHPDFAPQAAAVHERLARIPEAAVQKQMTVPVALSVLLPSGLLGLLLAIVISAAVTTDDTYLHSWGSIFVQDVLLPFRRTPLSPAQHIRALRWAIVGVAVFAYLFSLFFVQRQFILMFMATMGSIFLGGAGSCIVGGLYWKRGSAAGAWAAMITGLAMAVGAIVLQYAVPFRTLDIRVHAPEAAAVTVDERPAVRGSDGVWTGAFRVWKAREWSRCPVIALDAAGLAQSTTVHLAYGPSLPARPPPAADDALAARVEPASGSLVEPGRSPAARFFFRLRGTSGQVLYFFSMLAALSMYVLVSLAHRRVFDMDRLLHRGAHAIAADQASAASALPVSGWRALLGVTPEFTRGDRILYYLTIAWTTAWIAVYGTLIAMNLFRVRPDGFWINYHKYKFYIYLALGLGTTVWFAWGGFRDLARLIRDLRTLQRDDRDNGTVRPEDRAPTARS